MKKDVDLSRRKFLVGSASAILGGAIVGSIGGAIIKPGIAHAALPGYLPRPTNLLDVNLVKKLAFCHYFRTGG
jgi:hypothetical protein